MAERFPKPYVNDVKADNQVMEYINGGDFSRMGIGARPSGKPKMASEGPKSLDHVGMSAQGSKK